MSTKLTRIAPVLVCAAMAFSLSACSANPADNESAACDAYAAFTESVAKAKTSITPSSTLGEITGARDEIKGSYEKLQTALDKVGADRANALTEAWKKFDRSVDEIDPDLTIPEAISSLQGDVTEIDAARKNLDTTLVCN